MKIPTSPSVPPDIQATLAGLQVYMGAAQRRQADLAVLLVFLMQVLDELQPEQAFVGRGILWDIHARMVTDQEALEDAAEVVRASSVAPAGATIQ